MNNPYIFHPPMAPFTPRPCPPVPPPPARHPGLYEDMDGYTRKEIDDADARTLASAKGYADGTKVGKADLFDNPDSAPKIKSELLPSYVDDVLEYASLSDFPAAGESGKIYIAKDTNKTYRWSGTQYVQVGGGGDVPITVVKRNGTALTPVDGAVDIEVPTGTAASKDVPASGDADENQVVLGNDSRLTDSRVPTQHYHSMDDISDLAFPNHKVWAATATGSGTLYTLTPFGNDFSLEEGCVIIYKCPADMGNAGVVYIKVGSAQHLLHWAKSGTQPTFSSVKSGDICIIQFRSDYGGWWALHGVNAYTAYQKPATGIPASDLADGVIPSVPVTSVNTKTGAVVLSASDIGDGSGGTVLGGLQRLDSTKANSASLAPAFSTSSTYAVGDYCTHEGLLYKCKTAVSTAGAWNAANWTAVAVTDEMGGGAPYYEIEYLESTGTQYIDTGVTAGLGVRVVAEVEWDSLATNDQAFGSAKKYSGSYSNRLFVCVAADSTGYVSAGADASYISPKTSAVAVTTGTRYIYDYTITASSATLLISGNLAISQSGTFSFAEPFPIFAFARNASGTAENLSRIKLYSLKIYSGDTLVRDYIPVRSGFDGGLLDRVTGAIFGNAGNGAFVLGQDVNPPVPTDSPAFTGTPTAPTAAAGTNTTQVATTAFVQSAIAALRSELGLT